ncbi:MAG: hypothetical protein PHP54_03020 [Clostridia bacterium]|nr:hypothetical protein [Clostridia bacterium]
MLTDKREEKIIECLKYAVDGKVGRHVEDFGEFEKSVEIYPHNDEIFILDTLHDKRSLLFIDRKILFKVKNTGEIELLGECEVRGPQTIDTCHTKEFEIARGNYDVLCYEMNGIFFGKKKKKRMQENISKCIELSERAIELILDKYSMNN